MEVQIVSFFEKIYLQSATNYNSTLNVYYDGLKKN